MSLMECKYISVQAKKGTMNGESCSKDNSEKKKRNKETGVTLIAAVKNSACLLFPNLRDFFFTIITFSLSSKPLPPCIF